MPYKRSQAARPGSALTMPSGYTYIWEFQVSAELQAEFEQCYGPDGAWVQLFREASGYIDTLLLKDRVVSGRYLSLDSWQSEAAYLAFREQYSLQYSQLNLACERLTLAEHSLGTFSERFA